MSNSRHPAGLPLDIGAIEHRSFFLIDPAGQILDFSRPLADTFNAAKTVHSVFPGLLEEVIRQFGRRALADVEVRYASMTFWAMRIGADRFLLERRDDNAALQLSSELDTLKAQFQKVEKLAALGDLVAQLSHEVNTPLGVCVTTASHLTNRISDLERSFNDQKLSRGSMERFISDSQISAKLINSNLRRAANIIKSLRSLAHDIRRHDREKLQLLSFITDTVAQLSPITDKHAVSVSLDIPADIVVYHSPSALAQVVSNLIVNSIKHGFRNFTSNLPFNINIIVQRELDHIRVHYSDNGRGVPEDIRNDIFKPFTSGSKSDDSTGIGLAIVRDIVENQLEGVIEYVPSKQGACFSFTMGLRQ